LYELFHLCIQCAPHVNYYYLITLVITLVEENKLWNLLLCNFLCSLLLNLSKIQYCPQDFSDVFSQSKI
jgi:hypothetical protein